MLANPTQIFEYEKSLSIQVAKQGKQLSAINRETPKKLVAVVALLIEQVCQSINVPMMTPEQIAYCANCIIAEYWYLKIDEIAYVFKKAKLGTYGKLYHRLDMQIIFEWLKQYDTTESQTFIEAKHTQEQKQHRNETPFANIWAEEMTDYEFQKWYEKYKERSAKAMQPLSEEEEQKARIERKREQFFKQHFTGFDPAQEQGLTQEEIATLRQQIIDKALSEMLHSK